MKQHCLRSIACLVEEESEDKKKIKERRKRKRRSVWVKPWLLKRDQLGFYDNLLQELRLEDA